MYMWTCGVCVCVTSNKYNSIILYTCGIVVYIYTYIYIQVLIVIYCFTRERILDLEIVNRDIHFYIIIRYLP